MKANTKRANACHKKYQFLAHLHHQSQSIASIIVAAIRDHVDMRIAVIQMQRYLRRNLAKVAYLYHLINFQDFFHSQIANVPQKHNFTSDQVPKSIPIDSLCQPSFTKPVLETSLPSIKQSRVSQVSLSSSKAGLKLGKYKSQSLKLQLEPISQTKIHSELRQRKIQQQNQKVRLQKQAQQYQLRLARLQLLNANMEVSYDYSGERLSKVDRIQNNLVEKLLTLKLKKQSISKKNELTPQAQNIEGVKRQKQLKKSKSKVGQKTEFTQFLDCQSLTDSIQINKGIRYSHNSLIFQEKKPKLQPYDLKNSLGKKKLSRAQFSKISDFVDKKRQSRLKKIKTEQMNEHAMQHRRAYSQTNLNSSRLQRRQMINIINPELRQSMLIRLADYESFLVIQKQFPAQNYEYDSQKDKFDDQLSVSSLAKNDQTKSRITDAASLGIKLPQIRQRVIPQTNEEDLVITKLNRELRNKLRI